jgi:glycosyltransferase involved in cell wall biosynthesis
LVDLRFLVQLRGHVRQCQPDVIHVCGLESLRALRMAVGWRVPVVLSVEYRDGERPGMLDRWLMRGVDRVLVQSPAGVEWCRKLGVERVAGVQPAVGSTHETQSTLDIPAPARCIVCLGAFDAFHPFRDAVWAFDILLFLYPDLHLLLVGDGPYRLRLEQFTRDLHCQGNVHFLGDLAVGSSLSARAEIAWAPAPGEAGMIAALEAMAAGLPVVGVQDSAVAEVVVHGTTGCLVPQGQQAELARETRLLLDDPARRRQLGEAGRQRANEQFSASELVRRATVVYQELQRHSG